MVGEGQRGGDAHEAHSPGETERRGEARGGGRKRSGATLAGQRCRGGTMGEHSYTAQPGATDTDTTPEGRAASEQKAAVVGRSSSNGSNNAPANVPVGCPAPLLRAGAPASLSLAARSRSPRSTLRSRSRSSTELATLDGLPAPTRTRPPASQGWATEGGRRRDQGVRWRGIRRGFGAGECTVPHMHTHTHGWGHRRREPTVAVKAVVAHASPEPLNQTRTHPTHKFTHCTTAPRAVTREQRVHRPPPPRTCCYHRCLGGATAAAAKPTARGPTACDPQPRQERDGCGRGRWRAHRPCNTAAATATAAVRC